MRRPSSLTESRRRSTSGQSPVSSADPSEASQKRWPRDWTVGVRIWVERDGQAVLGHGRLELLEEIERSRSISAAARRMRMSYRRAWLLVRDINSAAGEPL